MALTLNFTIRTPEKQFYQGSVTSIRIRTEKGLIKILPRHATFGATVDFSTLVITGPEGTEEDFIVTRGILMVSNAEKKADLLVLDCRKKSELSQTSAKEYLHFLEDQLAKRSDLSQFKLKYLQEEKLVLEKQIKFLEDGKNSK